MGFFQDLLNKLFGEKTKNKSTSTNFGNYLASSPAINVYEASVVRACIHTIAEEASKMIIKSVKVKDGLVITNKDEINDLFMGKPNELMTLKDMLYWTSSYLLVS